ncbi:phosphopantetheine-binding protein [Streptomyces sp. NPDC058412]|uniref:phosphopantetheine-binding protein n=1 Tax=Streptomyces sp. NPDC058412 TaxID=3346486 RepID=UPI0036568286
MSKQGVIPDSKPELQRILAERLGVNPSEVADDVNLQDLGMDSIGVMGMVSGWQRNGLRVDIAEFAAAPSLKAWWQLISG